jgi:hypothetical protein
VAVTEATLNKLFEPFPVAWKVKTYTESKTVVCVPFIPAEIAIAKLNLILGVSNWSVTYKAVTPDFIVASLAICVLQKNGSIDWVCKEDTGIKPKFLKNSTEVEAEGYKNFCSDALKRAAKLWGLGQFVKAIKPVTLETLEQKSEKVKYPKILKKGSKETVSTFALSDYINNAFSGTIKAQTSAFLTTGILEEPDQEDPEFIEDRNIGLYQELVHTLDTLGKSEKHIQSYIVHALKLSKETTFNDLSDEQKHQIISHYKTELQGAGK